MYSLSLWKVISVLLLFIKVAEPQFGLVISGLMDCIKNRYKPPSPGDVKFYFYTRNSNNPEVLSLQTNAAQNELSENDPNFYRLVKESSESGRPTDFQLTNMEQSHLHSMFLNNSAPLKVIIHGYNQSSKALGMQLMKDAYLSKGDYYVIIVDWSKTSISLCYPRVTKALPEIGKIIAKFLDLLVAGVSLAQVHLIGFSLGAHVAGYTGSFTKDRVNRITGLDPASPFIRSTPTSSLDVSDAGLVDLIHTSSDFLGKGKPFGHVDFYPNGGKKQPGCSGSRFDPCSHGRAVQFFIESINSATGFPATKCKSWPDFRKNECRVSQHVLMGDPCPHGLDGRYFLVTGDKLPFAEVSNTN